MLSLDSFIIFGFVFIFMVSQARIQKAEKAVEEFIRQSSVNIFSQDIVSQIVNDAATKTTTDKEMVREILTRLNEIHNDAKQKMLSIPTPTGSGMDAYHYQERTWYELSVSSKKETAKVFVTFSDEEIKKFSEGDIKKRVFMLVQKLEDERALLFADGRSAGDLLGNILSESGLLRIAISPEKFERGEAGFLPKKGGQAKSVQAREEEKIEEIANRIANDGTQRYSFNISVQDDASTVVIDANLTAEEIDAVKSEDTKKIYYVLYNLLEQGRINSISGKTGEEALSEISRLIGKDFSSVMPNGPIIDETEPHDVKPSEKYALREIKIKSGDITYRLYGDFTDKEKKAFKMSPRTVLLQKADKGELFFEEEITKETKKSIQQALLSPGTVISLGKESEIDKPEIAALWREKPEFTASETSRVAALEKTRKDTTISISLKARNFITENIRISKSRSEEVKFDYFVLSYQPTEKELKEYNESPATYGIFLSAVFANPDARKAFLEKHKGELSIYIPSEGYVDASKAFWDKYPKGVLISGKNPNDDERIRVGLLGSTLDAVGYNYPSGLEFRDIASLPNDGSAVEKSKRFRNRFDIPETGRAPKKLKQFTMIIKTANQYEITIESNGSKYSVFTRLYPEEYEKVKEMIDKNKIDEYLVFLEERMRNEKIDSLYKEDKPISGISDGINSILENGIDHLNYIKSIKTKESSDASGRSKRES